VTFRELSAVVTEVPAAKRNPDPPDTALHRSVIAALFTHYSVVPLPPGVVFRRPDTLVNWLELHYAVLHDALRYVDRRVEGRLHVRPAASPGPAPRADDGGAAAYGELSVLALEVFHRLGHDVVAWIVMPRKAPGHPATAESGPVSSSSDGPTADQGPPKEAGTGVDRPRDVADISASFLLERSQWREFADAVAGEARRASALHLSLTGPWPPYDFVRLQFGG
jgi:hypothetical protein